MKKGEASRTAEMVCIGRALADGTHPGVPFADPTAFALLSDAGRKYVEKLRANIEPVNLRERMLEVYHRRQSSTMVARTIAIDAAIREAHAPQLVILGAGLDGRAWRMSELRDTIVFEVDHPDTQREKRARISTLRQSAREVRFVPVDFERDSLDAALEKAGHDRSRATMWVWEGVVMYLTPEQVEASLKVIQHRSAASSRLTVLYHSPALLRHIVGFFLKRLGEPLRSTFSAPAISRLLAKYDFRVLRDEGLPEIGAAFSSELAEATKVMRHMRLVTAESVRA